jgi:hypothetical protein
LAQHNQQILQSFCIFFSKQCSLPFCYCSKSGTISPLNDTSQIPQFVLITIDGAINANNYDLFENVLTKNMSFPLLATFFIEHSYSDYFLIENLYAKGKRAFTLNTFCFQPM